MRPRSPFRSGQMVYMGEPAGYVIRLEDGLSIYFAGDTCLFGDMRLIAELHAPAIAFPIWTDGVHGRTRGLRDPARGRPVDLFRWRHVPVRRHAPDRRAPCARDRLSDLDRWCTWANPRAT